MLAYVENLTVSWNTIYQGQTDFDIDESRLLSS